MRGLGEPLAGGTGDRLGRLRTVFRRADQRDRLGQANDVEFQAAGLVHLVAEEPEIPLGRAVAGPEVDGADLHLSRRRRGRGPQSGPLPEHGAPLRPLHLQRQAGAVGFLGGDQHVGEPQSGVGGAWPADHKARRVQRLAAPRPGQADENRAVGRGDLLGLRQHVHRVALLPLNALYVLPDDAHAEGMLGTSTANPPLTALTRQHASLTGSGLSVHSCGMGCPADEVKAGLATSSASPSGFSRPQVAGETVATQTAIAARIALFVVVRIPRPPTECLRPMQSIPDRIEPTTYGL